MELESLDSRKMDSVCLRYSSKSSGVIAYGVTKLTDQIGCVTGVGRYVIASTALAAGKKTTQMISLHAKYQQTMHNTMLPHGAYSVYMWLFVPVCVRVLVCV